MPWRVCEPGDPAAGIRLSIAADRPMISPEFAFVCRCAGARSAPLPADVAYIETLDADRLAAIAHRHQVVPLVLDALRRAGMTVPPALVAGFDPVAPLRAAREAVRLRTLLAADGIAPLFLKGSALAVLAYGAIERRQFGDIDLLVRPSDARRAAVLLGDAGYRAPGCPDGLADRVDRVSRFAKDMTLVHSTNGHIVELHWRMTDNPREQPVCEREAVQWVELAPGSAIPTLGTEALFAYLCAHGGAHAWARLRWLADVAALLAQAEDGGNRLWRGAVARRQGRAAAAAILLAGRYFGTPPPPSFKRSKSVRLMLLLRLSRRVIEAGGGTTELARTRWRGWTEVTGKLLVASSPGDLAGWIMRLLFSVSDEDVVGGSRSWYIVHPLQRIPKLLARRRLRRQLLGASPPARATAGGESA